MPVKDAQILAELIERGKPVIPLFSLSCCQSREKQP